MGSMARVKRAGSKRSSTKLEPVVVYRGIKILPIYGRRRSATAEAVREALLTSSSTRAPKQSTTKPRTSKKRAAGPDRASFRRKRG